MQGIPRASTSRWAKEVVCVVCSSPRCSCYYDALDATLVRVEARDRCRVRDEEALRHGRRRKRAALHARVGEVAALRGARRCLPNLCGARLLGLRPPLGLVDLAVVRRQITADEHLGRSPRLGAAAGSAARVASRGGCRGCGGVLGRARVLSLRRRRGRSGLFRRARVLRLSRSRRGGGLLGRAGILSLRGRRRDLATATRSGRLLRRAGVLSFSRGRGRGSLSRGSSLFRRARVLSRSRGGSLAAATRSRSLGRRRRSDGRGRDRRLSSRRYRSLSRSRRRRSLCARRRRRRSVTVTNGVLDGLVEVAVGDSLRRVPVHHTTEVLRVLGASLRGDLAESSSVDVRTRVGATRSTRSTDVDLDVLVGRLGLCPGVPCLRDNQTRNDCGKKSLHTS